MKKIALFGLSSIFAISMVACTVGETDEGETNEVSNYENLPACSAKKNMAGISFIGQKFYVEEEDAYYLCKESGWVISDATPVDFGPEPVVVIDSSTVVGTAFVGGYFEQGSPVVLREVKLDAKKSELKETGITFNDEISSAKGDFVISNVSLYNGYALVEVTGLYYDMNTGLLSEDSIKLSTLVDMGDSDEVKVNLFSEMELPRIKKLVKNGYSVKAAKIQAEHELLTALGFGGSVADVDAAMLATGIVFRNTGDVSDMINAIKAFGEAFAENGVWNDEKSKTIFADFAYALENLKIRDEDNDDVIMRTGFFRKNLESFGLAKVPGFEAYVSKFWNSNYGLGSCGSARENAVVKNQNESSDSASAYFICKSSSWITASDFERDTVGLGAALDGTIMEGNVDNEKLYVYDTAGLGRGNPTRWLPIETAMLDEGRKDNLMADSLVLEKWIGYACTDFEDVRYTMAMTINEDDDSTYWGCNKRHWAQYDAYVYKVGNLCHEGIYDFDKVEIVKVGNVTRYLHCDSTISEDKKDTTWTWIQTLNKFDERYGICDYKHVDNIGKVIKYKEDGSDKYARCVHSGTEKQFSWVEGFTETDYLTQDEESCNPEKVAEIGKNFYVCTQVEKMNKDTLYFTWRKATPAEKDVGEVCGKHIAGKVTSDGAKTDTKYYRCEYSYSQWMWVASNEYTFINYGEPCDITSVLSTTKGNFVCTDSVKAIYDVGEEDLYYKYSWREATKAEAKAGKPCTINTLGEKVTVKGVVYMCAQTYTDSFSDPLNPQSYLLINTDDVNFYSSIPVSWYNTEDNITQLQ
ncbi:MAG: hypothetical protein HUK21_09640 [Fibrobacteraceae bacterium]|nr:hypothetical protein [Fibrobacteraceae bacterium]MCF0216721.1 hypothetical protein [Fibrobacteraceae bacterium]